ncbi:hypothetical protein AC579_10487 [Pseudocercospora musae]|uniref:Clr5 domain-containing protein n=1 Tax=Pseudocercospora musae TaxID=113226 RepID=A0A139IB74_9PEZI|nr:hypothetical protein AC579_10487 [Pseudocercospora musae]KXT11896.1 hypothetical protein AC579_10487 [Pseudocercospora musae]
MAPNTKKNLDQHRPEIEQLTAAGESCENIAALLRAKGIDVSSKTVSRYRVNWGLRQRAEPATKGRTYPDRKRPSGLPSTGGPSKSRAQDARKAEITLRTQRGETADQIAAAFEAQGYHLNKGASTIWRLQTLWGLVPYDNARARGKNSKAQLAKQAAAADGVPKRRQRRTKGNVAPSNPSTTLHYPSECAFGPQKRRIAPRPNDTAEDLHSEPDLSAVNMMDTLEMDVGVNLAAEIMSAEMLVDLATSTLTAANMVKDLYLAQQQQRPLPGHSGVPTVEDIAAAKKKVREAAAVMHDLAIPNIVEGALT